MHNTRLLTHHRPVGCGVKNRPDGIRLGPNQPWKLRAAMPDFQRHQSFSNAMVLLSLSIISRVTCRLPSKCWSPPADTRVPELRTPQSDPLRLIKKLISLYLAQNKRTPCIPADRQWGRLSPPTVAQSKSDPFKLCIHLRCSPSLSSGACTSTPENMTHCFSLLCQPSCIALQHPA